MAGTDAPSTARAQRSSGRDALALLLGGICIALLCALGAWQVQRLHWKETLLATIDNRIHAEPEAPERIGQRLAAGEDIEYRPATAAGRFLHENERHFLATWGGQSGWNVYTPLLSEDGRTALFVNRGFVPYDLKDPARRTRGLTEGSTVVTGLARTALAQKPSLVPANDTGRNQFFWRSLPEMSVGLKLPPGARLLPFILDQGPGRADGGWPVGGTTIIDLPNNHLQYAITWFSLALVLAVMLGHWILRGRHKAVGAARA